MVLREDTDSYSPCSLGTATGRLHYPSESAAYKNRSPLGYEPANLFSLAKKSLGGPAAAYYPNNRRPHLIAGEPCGATFTIFTHGISDLTLS